MQRIRPKPPYNGPEPFQPFTVAYVDLGPVIVESPLFGRPVDQWSVGDAVALVAAVDQSGATTFHFATEGTNQ